MTAATRWGLLALAAAIVGQGVLMIATGTTPADFLNPVLHALHARGVTR